MTRVLVTGATGALGVAVTKYLGKDSDYETVTASRSGNETDLQLDITDEIQLSSIIGQVKPDIILQLAATFTHDFDEAYAVNVQASKELLDIVQRSESKARVLLIGSAAEYGVIEPDENPISECHVLNPVSVYGLTKAWQTQLAGLYSKRGVDVVVARVFNIYGENMSEKLFVGRLQKQIEALKSGRQSMIELGPLGATRDYMSIDNAVRCIFSVIEYGESGQVYNVASGEAVTMRELLVQILNKHDLDISVVQEAAEKSNRTGYDVPIIYADITKTKKLKDMSSGTGSV